jgi:tonB-dependent receptor protein
LSAANPAIADEQTKQSVNLGEVEVTANKISENLKDVPQSISVVSDTELQEREVKNVEELVKTMPNITGVGGMYEGISTRGLNPSIYTSSNPVTVYVSGVAQSNKDGSLYPRYKY